MAKLKIIIILTLFVNSCAENSSKLVNFVQPNTEIQKTLNIVTWNLQNFPKNGFETLSYLSELITEIDVDIIALQEIESKQELQYLINLLNGWNSFTANSASYDVDLTFLYRDDLALINISELEDLDYYFLPRTPLMMEFMWNNQYIYLINNHYKCCGDGIIDTTNHWDEEYRRLQSSTALKSYVESNLANENVILLGDLNDEIQDIEINNVFGPFLDDENFLFADLNIANSNSSNWSWPGWNSSYSASHFDHFIISNELFDDFANSESSCETLNIEQFSDLDWEEYYRFISDHKPVLLKLKINN